MVVGGGAVGVGLQPQPQPQLGLPLMLPQGPQLPQITPQVLQV